ncbi:hypothetical protein BC826DRAFT_1051075 [Russula brevipes]|nr:hypothetical protein BC826DRAFT_1051075 [Russula brevipes]
MSVGPTSLLLTTSTPSSQSYIHCHIVRIPPPSVLLLLDDTCAVTSRTYTFHPLTNSVRLAHPCHSPPYQSHFPDLLRSHAHTQRHAPLASAPLALPERHLLPHCQLPLPLPVQSSLSQSCVATLFRPNGMTSPPLAWCVTTHHELAPPRTTSRPIT